MKNFPDSARPLINLLKNDLAFTCGPAHPIAKPSIQYPVPCRIMGPVPRAGYWGAARRVLVGNAPLGHEIRGAWLLYINFKYRTHQRAVSCNKKERKVKKKTHGSIPPSDLQMLGPVPYHPRHAGAW